MHSYLSLLPLALQSILNTTSLSMAEFRFPPNPEWKILLTADLAKAPVNFFQLATVAEAFVPHVRTLTLKGFFGETGYSSRSEIPSESRNPSAASDVFFVTSHASQTKFRDLAVSNKVEAVFWIPAAGTQWRIRGHAVVLGRGDEDARKEMDRHLTKDGEWTWEKEIRKIYDGLDAKSRSHFESNSDEISPDFRVLAVVPESVEALIQKPVEKRIEWAVEGGNPEAKWVQN